MQTLEVIRRKPLRRAVYPTQVPVNWSVIQKTHLNYERGQIGHALIAKLTFSPETRLFHLEMFLPKADGTFTKQDFRTTDDAKEFVNAVVSDWLNAANLKIGA